mmetsp:Transcript_23079/g.74535  ORF Transcript_23079/g.74535 Transcript_23079/m.74535 type:complete len:358 (-) Transcript_23079:177-1250(-)
MVRQAESRSNGDEPTVQERVEQGSGAPSWPLAYVARRSRAGRNRDRGRARWFWRGVRSLTCAPGLVAGTPTTRAEPELYNVKYAMAEVDPQETPLKYHERGCDEYKRYRTAEGAEAAQTELGEPSTLECIIDISEEGQSQTLEIENQEAVEVEGRYQEEADDETTSKEANRLLGSFREKVLGANWSVLISAKHSIDTLEEELRQLTEKLDEWQHEGALGRKTWKRTWETCQLMEALRKCEEKNREAIELERPHGTWRRDRAAGEPDMFKTTRMQLCANTVAEYPDLKNKFEEAILNEPVKTETPKEQKKTNKPPRESFATTSDVGHFAAANRRMAAAIVLHVQSTETETEDVVSFGK